MNIQPTWYKLKSKRKGKKSTVSGEVLLQFILVDTHSPNASSEEIYRKYKSVLVAAEEEEEIISRTTTAESQSAEDVAEDQDHEHEHDSSEDDETDESSSAGKAAKKEKKKRMRRLRRRSIAVRAYEFVGGAGDVAGIIFMEICKITDLPPEHNGEYTSGAIPNNELTLRTSSDTNIV